MIVMFELESLEWLLLVAPELCLAPEEFLRAECP